MKLNLGDVRWCLPITKGVELTPGDLVVCTADHDPKSQVITKFLRHGSKPWIAYVERVDGLTDLLKWTITSRL